MREFENLEEVDLFREYDIAALAALVATGPHLDFVVARRDALLEEIKHRPVWDA